MLIGRGGSCTPTSAWAWNWNRPSTLDSTTIDLCLSLFPWARFRRHKGAVKLHTLLNLRGSIPTFVRITLGKKQDVAVLDHVPIEPGSFYAMIEVMSTSDAFVD